jgi:hypothetical protein
MSGQERRQERGGLTLAPVVQAVRRILTLHPRSVDSDDANRPRDCVRVFPALNGSVNLLGYDSTGTVQLEVRMAEARMVGDWQAWILDWLHAHESATGSPRLTLYDGGEDEADVRKAAARPLPSPTTS